MTPQTIMLILLAGGMLLLIAAAAHFSGSGNLDNIKSKTVGDGQHGTARWANKKEIQQTYRHIPFHVSEWRSGKNLPKAQGLVLGCVGKKNAVLPTPDAPIIRQWISSVSTRAVTAFFFPTQPSTSPCALGRFFPERHSLTWKGMCR